MDDSGLHELKCNACGAALHYEPGTEVLVCPHCNTEYVFKPPSGEYTLEFTLEGSEDAAAEAAAAEDEAPPYEAEALSWLRRGKKIEAIKAVRAQADLGLREAKEYVEGLAARNGIALKSGCATLLLVAFIGVAAAAAAALAALP